MIVRTCLLISDDPDDHIEFAEAIYEVSDNTVLVTVSDIRKSIDLLALKKCIPEYVFLNVGIAGFDPELLFATFRDTALINVRVIAYGVEPAVRRDLSDYPIADFFNSDTSFSALKAFFAKLFKDE